MNDPLRIPLPNLNATQSLAQQLAERIQPPQTIALVGTLGAGKTQLVRYLVAALGGDADLVTSPTYVLMQSYTGRCKIHHFDFYRLRSAAEVWDLGIDELFEQPCVILIEWADKFPECLPRERWTVRLGLDAADERFAECELTAP